MLDLFADAKPWQEPLASGAVILRRFAFDSARTGRRCRMRSLICANRRRRRRAMLIFNPMPA